MDEQIQTEDELTARRRRAMTVAVCAGLVLSILAVYAQVAGFDFVNYDDNFYVSGNAHVRAGLTPANVRWALTAVVVGNWAPVTLLSHLLDVQLFDMNSGMHHVTSVLFHALSSVLLFLVLRRATGVTGASAFVAFVFALHPLHVESVAWVSERKDVLSAFFWFLALYSYLNYCERPTDRRFLLTTAAFCLGLMSKAMMVTFPVTLLLLDVWPLRRAEWPKTVIEKLPLAMLSAGASAITYFAQKSAGALETIPLSARIENAAISCVTYIGQMFWPTRLACLYPYPESVNGLHAALAGGVILALTVVAFRMRHTHPYVTVGWIWYLVTLLPVVGLVQVGLQAHADRYMYIPMLGLLLILAGGAQDVLRKWPRMKPALAAAFVVCCAGCMAAAWRQTSYWENSETLFRHALDVTEDNWVAEIDMGLYLNSAGRAADALPHFENARRIRPNDARVPASIGDSLIQLGDCTAAIPQFQEAIRLRPGHAKANYNLGYCLATHGDDAGAIPYFETAVRTEPDFADAHVRMGMSLGKFPERVPEAIREYEAALRVRPNDVFAHTKLGALLGSVGRTREAIAHLEAAQRIDPNQARSRMLADLRAR